MSFLSFSLSLSLSPPHPFVSPWLYFIDVYPSRTDNKRYSITTALQPVLFFSFPLSLLRAVAMRIVPASSGRIYNYPTAKHKGISVRDKHAFRGDREGRKETKNKTFRHHPLCRALFFSRRPCPLLYRVHVIVTGLNSFFSLLLRGSAE